MSTSQSIRDFLDKIGEEEMNSYYKILFDLIDAMSPQITEHDGLACMLVLKNTNIYLLDNTLVGLHNEAWLTISEIAMGIAIVFQSVSDSDVWWKWQFSSKRGDADIRKLAKEFIAKLKQSGKVLDVIDILV